MIYGGEEKTMKTWALLFSEIYFFGNHFLHFFMFDKYIENK